MINFSLSLFFSNFAGEKYYLLSAALLASSHAAQSRRTPGPARSRGNPRGWGTGPPPRRNLNSRGNQRSGYPTGWATGPPPRRNLNSRGYQYLIHIV